MSRDSRTRFQAALALMALIAGVGCSSLPTGPKPDVAPDGASTGGAETAGTAGANPTPILFESATSSKPIYGVLGGRVSAGNFTVILPPSAVSSVVTVTVTQPDVSKPVVSLHITPASANKFKTPVTLVVDASRMSTDRLARATLTWHDPETGNWVPMSGCAVDLERRTIQAPLQHFSEYAIAVDGKAGW